LIKLIKVRVVFRGGDKTDNIGFLFAVTKIRSACSRSLGKTGFARVKRQSSLRTFKGGMTALILTKQNSL